VYVRVCVCVGAAYEGRVPTGSSIVRACGSHSDALTSPKARAASRSIGSPTDRNMRNAQILALERNTQSSSSGDEKMRPHPMTPRPYARAGETDSFVFRVGVGGFMFPVDPVPFPVACKP